VGNDSEPTNGLRRLRRASLWPQKESPDAGRGLLSKTALHRALGALFGGVIPFHVGLLAGGLGSWYFISGKSGRCERHGKSHSYDRNHTFHGVAEAWLTGAMKWQAHFGLRSIDFGELAVSAAAGLILIGAIALSYWQSDEPKAKTFFRCLLPWLAALAFFGVGVDMFHITVSSWVGLYALMGLIEDGGEMVIASVLASIVWRGRL
jgi:hypothetical protein